MKKEQMVGARIPMDLVRELELIENVEQSDHSTTVRRLLSQAIQQSRTWEFSARAPVNSEAVQDDERSYCPSATPARFATAASIPRNISRCGR